MDGEKDEGRRSLTKGSERNMEGGEGNGKMKGWTERESDKEDKKREKTEEGNERWKRGEC